MKDGALSNPMQFAHQTAESSFLRSTFNREFRQTPNPDPESGMNTNIARSGQSQLAVVHTDGVKEQRNNAEGRVTNENV
ncbi:hypothetical protein MD484_g5200, partial [Candolleomyces efflorescens]